MDDAALKEWFKLSDETKKNIFGEISNKTGLPPAAVEKDWWVVRTLDLIFQMEVGPHTVFKGGTSLSKAWNLIDRFSEDIDLALDKKFLGFDEVKTGSKVKKLREKSFKFISETFYPQLKDAYKKAGFDVELKKDDEAADDQDPIILEVYYKSVTEKLDYLPSRVLIEIGSRSLMEPSSLKSFCSLVGEHFSGKSYSDGNITIPTVNPERTFLEKIFLLHENFQLPAERMRVERLSRHFYDIEKIMDTEFDKKAFENGDLYNHLVEHRKLVTLIRGIDYDNHIPAKINPVPPVDKLKEWEADYKKMQESMIYKESLSFDKLIGRIKELKDRINKLKF
ncbi:MAG: nucleotidyl transferase AbiEii/AbiGii toxin family protein [Ignavibacteriota bacterium]